MAFGLIRGCCPLRLALFLACRCFAHGCDFAADPWASNLICAERSTHTKRRHPKRVSLITGEWPWHTTSSLPRSPIKVSKLLKSPRSEWYPLRRRADWICPPLSWPTARSSPIALGYEVVPVKRVRYINSNGANQCATGCVTISSSKDRRIVQSVSTYSGWLKNSPRLCWGRNRGPRGWKWGWGSTSLFSKTIFSSPAFEFVHFAD